MTKQITQLPMTYRDSVMIWGNLSPWKKLELRVRHKVDFQPHEVVRDGKGNIVSMPLLPRKPCFGRPEAFFRHGKRSIKIRLPNGWTVNGTKHQCGSCPAGVWRACGETAWERVNSDAQMRQAFDEWLNHCEVHHGGQFTYTGAASRLWGAFKEAIAARGPFENSNDAALEKLEIEKREDERRKWVKQKRRHREERRESARRARQLPSGQFVLNLQDERDRRQKALLEVLGRSDQPPSRRKVPASKAKSTATITANAWAGRELLHVMGQDARPGTIARLLAENGLSAGTSYATLKARIANDLKRADECVRDGVWQAFDPDHDLEHCEIDDEDEAAGAVALPPSDCEWILTQLDLEANLGVAADDPLLSPPTEDVHAFSQ